MNLPQLFTNWIDRNLYQVNEQRATCHDCLRLRQKVFNPQTKCCTYMPFLTNYAVGAILSEPKSALFIQPFLASSYALPIGILPSNDYRQRFIALKPEDFGKRLDLRCPYFDEASSGCGVWAHRSSACISYFCESSFGSAGEEYWQNYEEFLRQIEVRLTELCLGKMGLNSERVDFLMQYLPHGPFGRDLPLSGIDYWEGLSADQKSEFYINCYKYAKSLSKDTFWRLMGSRIQQERRNVEELRRNL